MASVVVGFPTEAMEFFSNGKWINTRHPKIGKVFWSWLKTGQNPAVITKKLLLTAGSLVPSCTYILYNPSLSGGFNPENLARQGSPTRFCIESVKRALKRRPCREIIGGMWFVSFNCSDPTRLFSAKNIGQFALPSHHCLSILVVRKCRATLLFSPNNWGKGHQA